MVSDMKFFYTLADFFNIQSFGKSSGHKATPLEPCGTGDPPTGWGVQA